MPRIKYAKDFMEYSKFYPELTDGGVQDLYQQAEIVRNMHFKYVTGADVDDITSVAIIKSLELVGQGNFDPTRSSFKNYIYTAMRNEMKNYLYKSAHETAVEDEILIGANEASTSIDDTDSYIRMSVDCLRRCTDEEKRKTEAYLNSVGFITTSFERGCDPSVERWVALTIWQNRKGICFK